MTKPFALDVPPGRRRSPSRFVRVLFNEACQDRISSLSLENYREWINGSEEEMDTLARIAIHKAIRERGGIAGATRCRVVIMSEAEMERAVKTSARNFDAVVFDYSLHPQTGVES